MQHLSDKYNVIIIRVHDADGHSKSLIDAISSFRGKNVLRQSENSLDICS